MKRILSLRTVSASLTALGLVAILGTSAQADSPRARIAPQTALVAVGSDAGPDDTRMDRDHQVLFRNDGGASTRIVFAKRNADGVDCETDGTATTRSREGQYLLRAGAELACALAPGRYRYSTYTQIDGAVQSAEARIRVQ